MNELLAGLSAGMFIRAIIFICILQIAFTAWKIFKFGSESRHFLSRIVMIVFDIITILAVSQVKL